MSEVEGEDIKVLAVHDHHLPVIAHEVAGGTRDRNSTGQKIHLQLAQTLFTAAVRECNQGVHKNAALNRVDQRTFDLGAIKTEDHNFDALLRLPNAFDQSLDSVAGLDDEFHWAAKPRELRCRAGARGFC